MASVDMSLGGGSTSEWRPGHGKAQSIAVYSPTITEAGSGKLAKMRLANDSQRWTGTVALGSIALVIAVLLVLVDGGSSGGIFASSRLVPWLFVSLFGFLSFACATSPMRAEIDAHGITVRRVRLGVFRREWRMEESELRGLRQVYEFQVTNTRITRMGGPHIRAMQSPSPAGRGKHYLFAIAHDGRALPVCWDETRKPASVVIEFAGRIGLCGELETLAVPKYGGVFGSDGGGDSGDGGDGGDGGD